MILRLAVLSIVAVFLTFLSIESDAIEVFHKAPPKLKYSYKTKWFKQRVRKVSFQDHDYTELF